MINNLPIYKGIEITKKNGSYVSYKDASILLTGNHLIIIIKDLTISGNLDYEQHIVYNLDSISSYKLK